MKAAFTRTILVALAVAGCAGCRQEMWVQPKYNTEDMSEFYGDTMSARTPVAGTVARGQFHSNEWFYTGMAGTNEVNNFPLPVTMDVLKRGQQRYDIYCDVCHGPDGEADGMIVLRGFPKPPSFYRPDLMNAPVGHFVKVITYGHGVMYPYANRVAPEDRWKVAAYIRALQFSHRATLQDVPPNERQQLQQGSQ